MANLLETGSIKLDPTGKRFKVTILEGDRQGSSAYYPSSVLETDEKKFAGTTRIYLDHPTKVALDNHPERSARDIIGYVENGHYAGKDIEGEAVIFSEWQTFVKERAEAGVIGLSIRASGKLDESGTLQSFDRIMSVDLVTEAGAGGKFVTVLESANESSASESVAESQKKEEIIMDEKLAAALDALVESNKATSEAVKVLTERAAKEDADKATALAEAQALEEAEGKKGPSFAEIDKALTEAELSPTVRTAVLTLVEAGADLAETVAAKKAEVEAILTEAGGKFAGDVNDENSKTFTENESAVVSGIYG